MHEFYGARKDDIFKSCLAVDNLSFKIFNGSKKKFDIMYSGQFINRKQPFFFVEVAKKLSSHYPNLSILILGSGELEDNLLSEMNKLNINYTFPGFVQQDELPKYFSESKIFLFPTLNDPWGIVANEAAAAGLPIITTENAGCANELVIHKKNGYVLPLNSEIWVKSIKSLLNDEQKYIKMSKENKIIVSEYNFLSAARGINYAIRHSLKKR